MSKTVFLEPSWKLHSSYSSLIDFPPEGYVFHADSGFAGRFYKTLSGMTASYLVQQRVLGGPLPVNLIKSHLDKFKKLPEGTALTYSCGHLVLRKEPWVVDLEYAPLLAGYNVTQFGRYKSTIRRALENDTCKGIICWSEAGAQTVRLGFRSPTLDRKICIVPRVPRSRNFIKPEPGDKTILLFVNSNNIPGQFFYKGGLLVLAAYEILGKKYPNVELIMRSDMPRDLKRQYGGLRGIHIIDKTVPWAEMERIFTSADIFLFPAHCSQDLVVLDAMSFELPVVISDLMANGEVVEDGKTGLLIRPSRTVPCFLDDMVPSSGTTAFERAIRKVDPGMLEETVEKTSILVGNEALRRKLGKAGRWEIENGKFSVQQRNRTLKELFDRATS